MLDMNQVIVKIMRVTHLSDADFHGGIVRLDAEHIFSCRTGQLPCNGVYIIFPPD